MSDDLVKRARLAQFDTGADLYGDLSDRIEELEAKLAKAKHTLRCVDRRMNDLGGYDGRFSLRKIVSITLAELTGGEKNGD